MSTAPRPPAPPAAGLRRSDFKPLAVNGWGDGYNSYAHSMAWFDDHLYVGSTRANLHLGKLRVPAPEWPVYPVKCPDDLLSLDVRARIWRWSPRSGEWTNVHTAGTMRGVGGQSIPTEIGYRGMTVFRARGDSRPVLYVSSYSGWGALRDPNEDQGPRIFRSEDGRTFEPISAAGLGREEGISAFRSLVPFKGRLFTSPVGTIRSRPNVSPCPMVFESADPSSGEWTAASEPGFGSRENVAIFEMAVFNGYLYAGTGNIASGFELWKTDAEGRPPYRWQQVLKMGAYRGNLSEGVLSLCVFGDALYVGTAIQDGGYDREYRVGPSPGEVLRVFPDDTWEIVAGTARLTPLGVKVPVSGLRPGLNNFFNGYIWRMCVHDGWLYVGTFDWSAYMRYFAVDRWPEILREFVARLGVEETIRQEGGCDLMRTKDGNRWFCVTRTGFDNPYNSGIRTMVSTPHGLVVGTINPFGPEVAVQRDGEWAYVPNLRGGLEVWLGQRDASALASEEDDAGDEIVGMLPLPAAGEKKAPQRRRVGQKDPKEFEMDPDQLRDLARKIDVRSVRPDLVSFATKFHHMRTEGAENIPREGGVLITCNHVGSPVFAGVSFNSEDGVLFAHVLLQELGRPVRFLADHGFYDTELAARMCGDTVDKLGFVPISIGNGRRLLEMGETVVIYPEGRYSSPDYRLQPFFWGFAKIAFLARAPIVPSILIGPHESRQRVERQGRFLYLNPYSPAPADYKFVFLPPVNVRDYVDDLSDKEALGKFTKMMERLTQEALDRECAQRPAIEEIRALQSMYGSDASKEAGARGV